MVLSYNLYNLLYLYKCDATIGCNYGIRIGYCLCTTVIVWSNYCFCCYSQHILLPIFFYRSTDCKNRGLFFIEVINIKFILFKIKYIYMYVCICNYEDYYCYFV